MKLLDIIFDSKLTFVDHFKMIKNETSRRINQLQSVTNCCFGPTQLSLQNMYVAYIRSVLEYGALVWYPFLSVSNRYKLETLENRALRKIIGVPISTRILDLHLESNIPPIRTRWDASVAFQSEKYRRHSISDPLNVLAYEQIKPRLKCKS